jgi:thymidylate synthase (FAD)
MATPLNTSVIWATENGDALIAKIARVSNPANEDNPKFEGLIRYLIRHNHWSPFEMVSMCISIHTTRDISAQIIRHRSFSFQEFSQRYSEPPVALIPDIRREHPTARQSSINDVADDMKFLANVKIQAYIEEGQKLYKWLTENGIAKECARKMLPINTPTHIYMSGTLRSWLHYVALRTAPDTQAEHRKIASGIAKLIRERFPSTANAFFASQPHIDKAIAELDSAPL